VQLTPSIAQAVVARSICIEKFIRLLGEGSSLDHLIENAQRRAAEDPRSLAIVAQGSTFAFKIDTFYGKTDRTEQTEIIDRFAELPFRGRVEMTETLLGGSSLSERCGQGSGSLGCKSPTHERGLSAGTIATC
jgi:hypothetical protein